MPFGNLYRGKRVLVTGHTGFKGSWLCEWLLLLGAEVTGYSIDVPTVPALFEQLGLTSRLRDCRGDVRDAAALLAVVNECKPDFAFHLAAQPLVRLSYQQPAETWQVNVMGTVNMMEALRTLAQPCAALMITTDKCYENREWVYGYREEDRLGGHDPYSSSKAAAEIAISAWQKSFFKNHPVRIASARAGNVIGGGDWAQDRIVPDSIRALSQGAPIPVRNPSATRPWQHVLEPLSGYLWLAACLAAPQLSPNGTALCSAFNFGPGHDANRRVSELVSTLLQTWPGKWLDGSSPDAPHEAGMLHLSTDKAQSILQWRSVWNFDQTIARTASWYRQAHDGTDTRTLTQDDIAAYITAAVESEVRWVA